MASLIASQTAVRHSSRMGKSVHLTRKSSIGALVAPTAQSPYRRMTCGMGFFCRAFRCEWGPSSVRLSRPTWEVVRFDSVPAEQLATGAALPSRCAAWQSQSGAMASRRPRKPDCSNWPSLTEGDILAAGAAG